MKIFDDPVLNTCAIAYRQNQRSHMEDQFAIYKHAIGNGNKEKAEEACNELVKYIHSEAYDLASYELEKEGLLDRLAAIDEFSVNVPTNDPCFIQKFREAYEKTAYSQVHHCLTRTHFNYLIKLIKVLSKNAKTERDLEQASSKFEREYTKLAKARINPPRKTPGPKPSAKQKKVDEKRLHDWEDWINTGGKKNVKAFLEETGGDYQNCNAVDKRTYVEEYSASLKRARIRRRRNRR